MIAYEPMIPDEEGWSEWIHPLPGYLMQCCDCGLVHRMEFAIGERVGDGPLNEGESDETGVVLFRARRHDSDSDGSPEGRDAAERLDGTAATARAGRHRPNDTPTIDKEG